MNNTQFFVAIGVPVASFLLVFMASAVLNRNAIADLRETMRDGLAASRAAIDDLRSEMRDGFATLRAEMAAESKSLRTEMAAESGSLRSEMASGFAAANLRVDDLRAEMASGFAAVNQRVDDLRSETTAGFAGVNLRVDDLGARVGRLEVRLDSIDNELRIGHERRIAILEAHVLGRAS